ncbi:MAG: hypothetical protein HOB73_05900 [Planctomycetaceae bacterium]|jgi:hypothetical protein|nr:hypothetical protein [Planctomycetaceae bacterium]
MDLITFAVVVALLEFVVGLSLLISPVRGMEVVREVLDNSSLWSVIMFGFLIVSVTAVVQDGEFTWELRGVITWLAIVTSVKALLYIWFPDQMQTMQGWFLRRDKPLWTRCIAVLMLLFCAFLGWSAYAMLQL